MPVLSEQVTAKFSHMTTNVLPVRITGHNFEPCKVGLENGMTHQKNVQMIDTSIPHRGEKAKVTENTVYVG